jgi:glycerol-3-phosphate dehydrogenase
MIDKRTENIARLKSQRTWDVLIIGGGINGAGIARDLMLRDAGLSVALVEKNHFSSGTSGRNSQLIHGGLRYLKYFDFGLVHEALRERATLLRTAPALVKPLQFLIPCYGPWDRWFYGAGLTLYDALSGRNSIGHHQALSGEATASLEPGLDAANLRAGLLFFDGAVHSARLVIENLVDAEKHGACIANYVEWREGVAHDRLTGDEFPLRAKRVVDAAGSWSTGAPLRLVRGSHLVFPRIQSGHEAIAYFDEQGRIVFLIPWGENDDLTLVGTTDVDHQAGADQVQISLEESEYLKSIVRRLFPLYRGEPVASYSSLRPLIAQTGRSATSTSREHRIWESADGVLHISGGKYTTYRSMSEELVDMITPRIPCRTAEVALEIPEEPGETSARIRKAVEREFARRLPDLLQVSTYWGYERRADAAWLRPLAAEMGDLLGWDARRVEAEVEGVMGAVALP